MEDLLKKNRELLEEKADEEKSYFLLSLANKPEKIWAYLNFFANYYIEEDTDEEEKKKKIFPYHYLLKSYTLTKKKDTEGKGKIKIDTSYVQAVKTAIKRYDTLKKSLCSENSQSSYRIYQEHELNILDAYAINVLFDVLWVAPNIFEECDKDFEAFTATK